MEKLERHPLSEKWGTMTPEQFGEFVQSVRTHGLLEPEIWIYDGQVLDGWHRYLASMAADREGEVIFREYTGDDPAGFVIGKNAYRRHLSAMDRARIVVSCREWRPVGNPDFVSTSVIGSNDPIGKTTAEMAAEAGVSESTVKRARAEARDPAPPVPAAAPKVSPYRQLQMDFTDLYEQYTQADTERRHLQERVEYLEAERQGEAERDAVLARLQAERDEWRDKYNTVSQSYISIPKSKKRERDTGRAVSPEFIARMVEEFPTVAVPEQVELALSHKAADKYRPNLEPYVRNWLRRQAEWKAEREAQGGGRPTRSEPSTDADRARTWGGG